MYVLLVESVLCILQSQFTSVSCVKPAHCTIVLCTCFARNLTRYRFIPRSRTSHGQQTPRVDRLHKWFPGCLLPLKRQVPSSSSSAWSKVACAHIIFDKASFDCTSSSFYFLHHVRRCWWLCWRLLYFLLYVYWSFPGSSFF